MSRLVAVLALVGLTLSLAARAAAEELGSEGPFLETEGCCPAKRSTPGFPSTGSNPSGGAGWLKRYVFALSKIAAGTFRGSNPGQ